MTNKDQYDEAFIESFSIEKEKLIDLEYDLIEAWDSVGHMTLMGILEETFDIALDMEDIIDFSSYKKGFELLKKYGVDIV